MLKLNSLSRTRPLQLSRKNAKNDLIWRQIPVELQKISQFPGHSHAFFSFLILTTYHLRHKYSQLSTVAVGFSVSAQFQSSMAVWARRAKGIRVDSERQKKRRPKSRPLPSKRLKTNDKASLPLKSTENVPFFMFNNSNPLIFA